MSHWDLLPLELVEYIHFHRWQLQLREVHTSLTAHVDPTPTGCWLFRYASGNWKRPLPVDDRVGWGTEWTSGVARHVRVQNVGHRLKAVFRNIPLKVRTTGWWYKYRPDVKDFQHISCQLELDSLQEIVQFPE